MKSKNLLLGILVIMLVFTMTAVGCSEDPTDDNGKPQTLISQGVAAGYKYILTITENKSRATYIAVTGDSYELRITKAGEPDKVSKGTVSANSNGTLTLQPEKAGSPTFSVSMNGQNITAITGTITLENGETTTAGDFEERGEPSQPTNPTFGDFSYTEANGNITITKYNGTATSVEIPAQINGKPVTTIGQSAFWQCTSLASITIPNSVTSIGGSAFSNCTSLASITIPNSVTSIGDYAFNSCTSLASVTIGNGVTSIGNGAFSTCRLLASITIPASVTTIERTAFQGCTSLTAITVDTNNNAYSSDDGVVYNKNKTTLVAYPGGKTGAFTIPAGVTSIGEYAFMSCIITNVTIPDNVTSIGDSAFYSCGRLASVTITASVTSIPSRAFSGCFQLNSVTFQGTILSDEFNNDTIFPAFPGDLRDKYLAADGGVGTYKSTGIGNGKVWTKQ